MIHLEMLFWQEKKPLLRDGFQHLSPLFSFGRKAASTIKKETLKIQAPKQ